VKEPRTYCSHSKRDPPLSAAVAKNESDKDEVAAYSCRPASARFATTEAYTAILTLY